MGLQPWQYEAMQVVGICEICTNPSPEKLMIDHDHETGALRGFLCRKCNTALGQINDDPWVLDRMAKFLERNAA